MSIYNILSLSKGLLKIIFNHFLFLFDFKNYLISKKILKILLKRDMYIIFLHTNAFGHCIATIDYLDKYCIKKNIDKKKILLICASRGNSFFFNKIKKHYCIFIRKKIFHFYINRYRLKNHLHKRMIIMPNDNSNYLPNTNSTINFTDQENKFGLECLSKLGLKNLKKVVVISYKSWTYHSKVKNQTYVGEDYRISDPKNLKKTLEYLKINGYQIIISNTLHKDENEIFKEYHKLDYFNDNIEVRRFLEFYIYKICEFAIVGASGDQFVPKIFNKLALYHNAIFPHTFSDGVYLPKKIFDNKTKNTLTLKNFMKRKYYMILFDHIIMKLIYYSPIYFRSDRLFLRQNIYFQDNSPDEILEATKELIDYVQNKKISLSKEEEKLQLEIKEIYFNGSNIYKPKNENFFKSIEDKNSLDAILMGGYVSPSFLKNNKNFVN